MSGPIPVGEIIVVSVREKMLRSESNADANRHDGKPFEYRTSNSKVRAGAGDEFQAVTRFDFAGWHFFWEMSRLFAEPNPLPKVDRM
jgi:hypothetical protein